LKFRNNSKSRRNIYLSDGLGYYYTEYHTARRSTSFSYFIIRYLPEQLAQQLFAYLTYIQPFTTFLYAKLRISKGETHSR